MTELDSFITKFHQLWRAGHTAHLDLDTHAGKAWVGIRVQLGPAPGPAHKHSSPPPRRRAPAYLRRQERRRQSASERAEPTTAGKVVVDKPLDRPVSDLVESEADKAPTVQVEGGSDKTDDISAAKADAFDCVLCDFSSNWEYGLKIHMSRKHDKIEQLDGINDSVEDQEENEYEGSKHFWKSGWLGGAYQSYLDAIEVVEKSDLDVAEKEAVNIKILEARKKALGSSYMYYPPWSAN